MKYIQNISDEKQLIRIQGTKQVLKPGEIAEVTEQEIGITKTYNKLFQEVDRAKKEAPKTPEEETPTAKKEAPKTTEKGSTQSTK